MKFLKHGAFALVLGGLLAGCGSQETSTSNTAPATGSAPAEKQMKVALLTPGDINDQGWNQLAHEGLKALEQAGNVKTAHQVTKAPADQQPALRALADDGYNLVLCHGFEYGDRVKQLAKT